MERALSLVLGAVVAVVVVLAAVAAVVWVAGTGDESSDRRAADNPFPPVEHDPAAAGDLIDAWARWRTATFVAEGTWTRTVDGIDGPLTGEVFVAQDPPRRLVVRLGSVIERIDDTITACDPDDDDTIAPPCTTGTGRTYDELVVDELALVGGYVTGDGRLYSVERTDVGCFRAELIEPVLGSPWGRWAEYCFADDTGALLSARVRRATATDVEAMVSVRADVTDADFGGGGG